MVVHGMLWCGQARADWRDDIGTFRIGIVAEPNGGNTVPGLAQLTQAFTNALGMKVEFVVARDYASLIEAQANARIEYAIYSATAYATAQQRCACVEPLVAPVDSDGAAGIRSVLLTRDGKLPGLADMETHRIVMPPPDSVGGSFLPLAGLAAEHVKVAEDAPFLIHADSASAAEMILVDGKADAMFGWVRAAADGQPQLSGGTRARLEAAGLSASALQVVWISGPAEIRSPHRAQRSRPGSQAAADRVPHQPQIDDAGCLRSPGNEALWWFFDRGSKGLCDGGSHRADGLARWWAAVKAPAVQCLMESLSRSKPLFLCNFGRKAHRVMSLELL